MSMADLPDRVKIGDSHYTILYQLEITDEKDEKLLGQCDFQSCTIKVVPNSNTYKNTLRHELVHAISYFMNADLTEKQVDQITNGLGMLFIDNPKLKDTIL